MVNIFLGMFFLPEAILLTLTDKVADSVFLQPLKTETDCIRMLSFLNLSPVVLSNSVSPIKA